VFKVLDWSSDGKFILFGYGDYAYSSTSQINSLGIIDVQTLNITKIDALRVSENNPKGIYLAKISPSSDSIFILMGTGGPEDIFRYDLRTKNLTPITNSSRISWFDTVRLDDAQLAYIGSSGIRFWPIDNPELGNKIDGLAGQYYVFLDYYSSSLGQGRLDLNDDASKIAVAAGPFESRGIIYVDISSAKTSVLQERTPCVSSVEFAPYDELLVYSEHPGQQCPFPLNADEWSGPLRVTSPDGTTDEILYLDTYEVLDVVLSPDGKYAATFGYGETKEDRSPKIMILQLPRPVPEFGSYFVLAAMASLIPGTILATRLKVNWAK
jgi:WD40 repeat protein